TAGQVAASSQELFATSEVATSSTNQITTSIQDIYKNSQHSSKSADENLQALHKMDNGVKGISERAQKLLQISKDTAGQADQGTQLNKKISSQMDVTTMTIE